MNLVEEKYPHLLELALELGKTCSILYPEDKAFTFSRNNKYLMNLMNIRNKEIWVVVPYDTNRSLLNELPDNIYTYVLDEEDNIEYVWTYIHNEVNKDREPAPVIIGEDCRIHPTAIIGLYGNTYAKAPDGSRLHLKEIGGVQIGDRVDVEAYSIVHKSCFGNTVVGNDVKICVMCNIGHNTKVGDRTYIAPGVKLGGGTQIGEDCFIWQGVITHSQVRICDRVMVGNGSYVHKSITKPGVYVGSPARWVKSFDQNLLKGEVQW